jgi:hypothetical protein
LSLGYKVLDIADWCKSARSWARAEGRGWLDSLRDISFRSKKSSRTPWNLAWSEGRFMAFSLRSDAENRFIGIGICANLWTAEGLKLMAWTRAERSIFVR